MGQIQSLEDLLNFLWRRRWLIAAAVVVGSVLSAFYAKSRADLYEATAAIQVQPAQVGSAGATNSAQLLQSIEQRLTTREALLAVIDRHGLYQDMPAMSEDEKAGFLRGMVSFQGVAAAGNAQFGAPAQISAILITGRDGEADKAARIANDFAQGVLDLSASGAMEAARETLAFYTEETTRLATEAETIAAERSAYQSEHADALPSSSTVLREELPGIDSDLRALDQALVALLEEQRQLAAQGDLRATEQRRLQALDAEIAVLTGQKAALGARRAEVQAALTQVPQVEQALAAFDRAAGQVQDDLRAARARKAEAEVALRLAERQQGDRFALLDRAVVPEWPIASGGRKFFAAGVVASFLAGLALALMLDLMNPVVRTTAQMERMLGLRPVIALPDFDPRRTRPGTTLRRLSDLRERAQALPPVVLVSGGLTTVLLVAAALV